MNFLLQRNLELLREVRGAALRLSGVWAKTPLGAHAPAGPHARHILDHYASLLKGLEAGRVDYHARERDPEVEQCAQKAAEACARMRRAVADAPLRQAKKNLLVRTRMESEDSANGEWAETSVERELAFCISHTLHHLAMIRLIGLSAGIDLGADFCKAPSTLQHEAKRG